MTDQDLSLDARATIREAMLRLDRTAEKCLFVVDAANRLVGAITDGDVRRAILSGRGLDECVEGTFNGNPLSVATTGRDDDPILIEEAKRLMRKHVVEVIPIVDDQLRILRTVSWTDLFGDEGVDLPKLRCPVVIMAGGLGTRLEPFTKVLPKPLIPVHDKPIIDHIIDRFVDVGINEFWLTVNYKSRILKAYFEDRGADYLVNFVDEPEPLGTAGGLRFLQSKVAEPFFVTNCDILIKADYRRVMDFHRDNRHAITLVGSMVHYQIPYGTCVLNGNGALAKIDEKPRYDFLVNTGMYVLNPDVLDLIPDDRQFHMTDLIDDVKAAGFTVGVFPVSEDSWIDIGQWAEFRRASERR